MQRRNGDYTHVIWRTVIHSQRIHSWNSTQNQFQQFDSIHYKDKSVLKRNVLEILLVENIVEIYV